MKKTLLASAILLAFAANAAVAAEPESLKGGTFSSAVQVDGDAVNFTSAVTLKGSATIEGKDGAPVDVNVNGTFTNQSTAEVNLGNLTTGGYLYTKAGSVLNAKDIVASGIAYNNAGTINAESLTIATGEQSKEVINVDKLVVTKSMNFTQADNVSVTDTLEISGHYVALANGTETQKIKNVVLSQTRDDGYRSELQLNGTNLEAENLTVSENAWGFLGSYSKGYTADVENLTVSENALFAPWGGSATEETLNIGTATFANNSTFMGDWDTAAPTDKTFDGMSISNLVINGNTNFAKFGELVHNERYDYDFYANEVANLKVGTIVLNEGKLTMNHAIQGMPKASAMARSATTSLNVIVNEGASVSFGSTVQADEINIQLNTLAEGSVDASDADVQAGSTVVTVPGELNNSADIVNQVKNAVNFGDNTYEAIIGEGMYNGGATIGTDGSSSVAVNSIMSNVLDTVSAQSLSMNRILMNDVRKRMGDLRSAEGTHGVWARYDGGKLSGSNEYENDFTTVQVGIDTVPVADAPRFGVAFAYTTADAEMKRGGAEMDAFSLAFYGTKMYDNGVFVDVIGRMATADTDVVVDGDNKGAMDNIVLSLSGELGWRFDVTDKFYFEPQAELTYTYVNADTLTLKSGHEYGFDSVDSLVGRVGFAAGFKCPNNFGDVYVRASAVHEFLGDSAVVGANGAKLETDGEDTYVEFGIGGQFNINKNTYVYADIERTEGAKLEEDWRANVGVRFAF